MIISHVTIITDSALWFNAIFNHLKRILLAAAMEVKFELLQFLQEEVAL